MSSMSEKPIKDDRKTDSWQDALNEMHSILFINCLVFDNKLWNYISKNPFQFQNSQIKTQQGCIFSFGLISTGLNLMKSIPTESLSNIRDIEKILQPSFRHISRFLSLTFFNHCVEKRAL